MFTSFLIRLQLKNVTFLDFHCTLTLLSELLYLYNMPGDTFHDFYFAGNFIKCFAKFRHFEMECEPYATFTNFLFPKFCFYLK